MGLLFADRSRRGPDPHLAWKVRLFFAGAVVALVAMAWESSWLMAVAVLLLGAGFVLRFLPGGGEGEDEGDEGEDERADGESAGGPARP